MFTYNTIIALKLLAELYYKSSQKFGVAGGHSILVWAEEPVSSIRPLKILMADGHRILEVMDDCVIYDGSKDISKNSS